MNIQEKTLLKNNALLVTSYYFLLGIMKKHRTYKTRQTKKYEDDLTKNLITLNQK